MFFDWYTYFYEYFTAEELKQLRHGLYIQKKRIDELEKEIHKRGQMLIRNHEIMEKYKDCIF